MFLAVIVKDVNGLRRINPAVKARLTTGLKATRLERATAERESIMVEWSRSWCSQKQSRNSFMADNDEVRLECAAHPSMVSRAPEASIPRACKLLSLVF